MNLPADCTHACRHKPKDPEECKRFISYSLEASGQLGRLQGESWDGLAVGIFDLRGRKVQGRKFQTRETVCFVALRSRLEAQCLLPMLAGMTMSNYDVGAMRAVFDLLQNHYPER